MARKAGLTRDQVVDAAAALADRAGLPAVTLTTVAETVGVRAPSLYAHVDGVEGLRRALAARAAGVLAERMAAAAGGEPDPRAALRAVAHAYRRFARDHPGLYASLLPAPRPAEDPEAAAAAAAPVVVVAGVLQQLGVPADRHVDLVRTLRAVLHGFVDLELGGGFGLADPVDASFDVAVQVVVTAVAAAA